MVNSVSNSITTQTKNTTQTTNITRAAQGTTTAAPSNGVQSPFGAVRAAVGSGVAAGAAVQAVLNAQQLGGLAATYNSAANAQMALTAGGVPVMLEGEDLPKAVSNLNSEIDTLNGDLNLTIDSYKTAQPDQFNDKLLKAWNTYDTDLHSKPPASDEQLAKDQQAIKDAKVPLQNKLDADTALRDQKAAALSQLQNASNALDQASKQLGDALAPFGDSLADTSLDTQHEIVRATTQRIIKTNQQLDIDTRDRDERTQSADTQQLGVIIGSVEQQKQLQQAIANGRRTADKVKAMLATRSRDGDEEPLTAAHLQYLQRTAPDSVLPRESGRDNGTSDEANIDDAAKGSANVQNAQGAVASADSSGPVNGNAVEGRGTVEAANTPHDTNPLNLTDVSEYFGHGEDPLAVADGAQAGQGVGGDVVAGRHLLHELRTLGDLLDKLGVPGGAASRGLYLAGNGDPDRMRFLV
jgi:hypothetical protein